MIVKRLLPCLTFTILTASPLTAQSIVGSWFMARNSEIPNDAVVTFLANGTYLMAEDGPRDREGMSGMERGTYQWNPSTKAFSSKVQVDTTARWGLSDGHIKSITVSGNMLTSKSESALKFKKIASPKSKLVGSWFFKKSDGYAMITFLANGDYFMAEDGNGGDGGRTGMERGTYKWDESTGKLTNKVRVDTNGTWGLSDHLARKVIISGRTLSLKVAGEGTYKLKKVVAN